MLTFILSITVPFFAYWACFLLKDRKIEKQVKRGQRVLSREELIEVFRTVNRPDVPKWRHYEKRYICPEQSN